MLICIYIIQREKYTYALVLLYTDHMIWIVFIHAHL